MENLSKTAIISLGISLLSLALFIAVFYVFDLLIPWLIVSVVAAFFPFYSKYRRMKTGTRGKGLEIAAFVIGMLAIYFILSFGFGLQSILLDVFILIICFLYWKLFNKVTPKGSDTE